MGALWAAGSSQQAPVWVSWALGTVWFSLRITPCHSRQCRGIDAGLQVKPEGRLTGLYVTVTNNPKLHGLKQHLLSPILLRRESECAQPEAPGAASLTGPITVWAWAAASPRLRGSRRAPPRGHPQFPAAGAAPWGSSGHGSRLRQKEQARKARGGGLTGRDSPSFIA